MGAAGHSGLIMCRSKPRRKQVGLAAVHTLSEKQQKRTQNGSRPMRAIMPLISTSEVSTAELPAWATARASSAMAVAGTSLVPTCIVMRLAKRDPETGVCVFGSAQKMGG